VAVLVPESFWTTLFLADAQQISDWLVTLENAMVAPFVAASTFIGSMGNIPLATVLNQNGVLFAGIMGFIYSDLMVPHWCISMPNTTAGGSRFILQESYLSALY
jgi:uncharacterized membrane protein YdjX (TVP38/TMEM64 family)